MKTIAIRLLYTFLIGAVFYFLGKEISQNWSSIRDFHFSFNGPLLGGATLAYIVSFILLAVGWWLLMRGVGYRVPLKDLILYFFITQPAKYIPGKIWVGVARNHFCKPKNVPLSITMLTTGLEGLFEVLAGMYISIIALVQTPLLKQYATAATMAVIIGGVILMIPKIFYFLVNIYLKLVKQPAMPREHHLSFLQLVKIQVVYIIAMGIFGLSQALFLISFTSIPATALPYLASIGAFTYVASILAFFTPSGLGVREGVWVVVLRTMIEQHVAIIFAFVSRLWTIVIEAVLACICLAILFARASTSPDQRPK